MNPLISKQVNVNSPQYYLRNEKKNLRSLSPGYAQVKKQNTTMPFTFPTEQSVLHSSVPTNTQEVENRKRDLAKLEEKMQETLSKSIEKTKVQHSKNSSKGYIASKSKSPMKTINPTTCKKISQDLPKSAQKILTEIANRSKSNNTSFSKINTQSFKPSQNPRILQNIYSHKRPAQDNQNSENNIQEEGNQTMQDETLESFYREIEKNKEYLSNQRAYSSVSPIAIDKKLLSTLEKNNKRVQQIYSQIQNQMKQKVASPNQGDTYGKHKPSPSKTDNRKVLYESYSQEKIHQILHGGQLLANIDQDGKLINNNNESRKPSPLFGGRQDENGGTHHSSQDSSSLNQFKSHLTDSPAAENLGQKIVRIKQDT